MDSLQSFFPTLKIKQAVYTRVELRVPWGLDFIPYRHTKFGIVTQGDCYLDLKDGEAPVKLEQGSCYLLTRGDAFRLRDIRLSPAVGFEKVLDRLEGRLLRYGGCGEQTTIVGGRFVFASNSYPPMLDLLPPLIHFKVNDKELNALVATIELLANETDQPGPGSTMMVDRLADIFFIQTLRVYCLSDDQRKVGWLGAVADEKLSDAIRLIHQQFQQAWSVAELARQVGMSRAVFSARFKAMLGTTPMAYLTRYRLYQAQQKLHQSTANIGQISVDVGYRSEAAFNKAFKRELGIAPGAYRLNIERKSG